MAQWFGLNPPFLGGIEGVLSRQEDARLIKNDLLQLLLTAPGERVMRPDFGTGIRQFVFEGITDESVESLKSNISEAIQKFEPRVDVSEVSIEQNRDNNQITIKIYGTFNLSTMTTQTAVNNLLVELNVPVSQNAKTNLTGGE